MSQLLKEQIINYLGDRVTTIGFAPVDRFEDAPKGHHPKDSCKGARTVIVYAIAMPQGMLKSPEHNLHYLHRCYHTVYPKLDDIGLELSNYIESQGDYLAVPVPAFAPLIVENGKEPWGLISLKHAAVKAGLGAFGKNGLFHHPRYGALLRPGAVITSAEIPGDPTIEESPCPPKCNACHEICPVNAFDKEGSFSKMDCLPYCIKHAIYGVVDWEKVSLERVLNTAGYNYWLECDKCLQVCPNNDMSKKET